MKMAEFRMLLAILSACCSLATIVTSCNTFSGAAANGKALELARDGKSDYGIVQSATATPAEKFAAQELGKYLEKVTGTKFPVVMEGEGKTTPPKSIYVGWTDYAKQHVDLAALGQEEWVVKTQDGNLVLTGGRPRGTLYAVHEFLEQQLGCHWWDEFTEIVPSKPTLELVELDLKGKPAFWTREIYDGITYYDQELVKRFRARNKDSAIHSADYGFGSMYGSPGGCHTFYAYSKDWQETHPEYLAMNEKGERVRSVNSGGPGQICLTNPEVRKLMLEKLRQYIIADREKAVKTGAPAPRIYCIESNDNNLTCQCQGCKALIERECANAGATVDLVNFLADGIKDEFPDVLVDTFAYLQTLTPPRTVRPRDNVIIRIAQLVARPNLNGGFGNRIEERPDYFRPMAHPVNRSCNETFLAWSKIAKHISYWDYWVQYCDKFPTPYINIDCLKPDMELLLDNNVEIIFVENEYSDTSSFFALKRWVGLKLMQNPRQPVEPLIKTFMAGYYGMGAGKVNDYLDYMRKRIDACPATEKLSFLEEKKRPYLDLEFFVNSDRLLDEAETLCASDKMALLHVQRERITVALGVLGMWDTLLAKLPSGKAMPFDREVVIKRCEAMQLAQIEAFWRKDQQDAARKKLEKEINDQRNKANLVSLAAKTPLSKLDLGGVREEHIMIPMRDGTRLSAYVYFPPGQGPWPVVFEQRYAVITSAGSRKELAALASHGYVAARVNFRGSQLSEGVWRGYRALAWGDLRDGYDLCEWFAVQPWSNGKVGTFGGSQAGFAQNFLAVTCPPHLVCQFMTDTGLSLYHEGYRLGGATKPERFKKMDAVARNPADNRMLMAEWFRHPTYDDYWRDEDCSLHFDRMNVPCFTIGSWYDFMSQGSIQSFIGRQHQSGPNSQGKQQLVIGPWLHGGLPKSNKIGEMVYPENAQFDTPSQMLRWFDHYLKNANNGVEKESAVRYYVMGAVGEPGAPGNIWRTANDWPVPAQDTGYYLHEGDKLDTAKPSAKSSATSYVSDPRQPMEIPSTAFPGARDARKFEEQKEVRTFTTAPLTTPVEWTGKVSAELYVASTAKDTDFIVRVSDVYPDGRSILIVDYVRRARYREGFEKEVLMKPGKIYRVAFDVGSLSQIFNAGHRIRVTVASTGAPFYEPQPQTGEPLTIEFPANAVVATNTVFHERRHASRVIAPVVR